jgi:tetratricopeptide (TPR) repeat protein
VAPIIRICKQKTSHGICVLTLIAAAIATPSCAVAAENPDDGLVTFVTAEMAEMNHQHAAALSRYAELFKANPDSSALAERLYRNAIHEGNMPTALRAARALELQNAGDVTAPLLLFADAFRRHDWREAEIANAAMEAKSNFGFLSPIFASWLKLAQGKPHGFEPVDPRLSPLLHYYSTDQVIYFELASGDFEKAKSLLAGFQYVSNDYARDTDLVASRIFAARNDAEFSRSLIRRRTEKSLPVAFGDGLKSNARLEATAGVATVFTRLANALSEQNVSDQAVIMARIANWIDPDSDPAKLALAKIQYAAGVEKIANAVLDSISAKSFYYSFAVKAKIENQLKIGRNDEALQLATRELLREPTSQSALLLVAQMHETKGNFSQAAEKYAVLADAAAKTGEAPQRLALYHLLLATALDKSGQWNQARQHLDAAKTLDPNNPHVLNYLGFSMLERREDLLHALEMVKAAYRMQPDSAAIADSLGWGYYLTGDHTNAILFLEKAAKQSANDVTINEHLGDAYWQSGRRVDARHVWRVAAYGAVGDALVRLTNKIDTGADIAAKKSEIRQ